MVGVVKQNRSGMNHLLPNWQVAHNIRAFTTKHSVSLPCDDCYGNNNLALHVGDSPTKVLAKRAELMRNYQLPSEPAWLEQTHSIDCVVVEEDSNRTADAAITRRRKQVIVVMTADCVPITVCDIQGTEVAVIHAGWRGLVNGIIENTIAKMHAAPNTLTAWIGPAICGKCYNVNDDVLQNFILKDPDFADTFIYANQKTYLDLPKIAELTLNQQGVTKVFQSAACTFENPDEYYSVRHNACTGRIATLIWID